MVLQPKEHFSDAAEEAALFRADGDYLDRLMAFGRRRGLHRARGSGRSGRGRLLVQGLTALELLVPSAQLFIIQGRTVVPSIVHCVNRLSQMVCVNSK